MTTEDETTQQTIERMKREGVRIVSSSVSGSVLPTGQVVPLFDGTNPTTSQSLNKDKS